MAKHIKNRMVLLLYVVIPVNVCNDSRIMNDLTTHIPFIYPPYIKLESMQPKLGL